MTHQSCTLRMVGDYSFFFWQIGKLDVADMRRIYGGYSYTADIVIRLTYGGHTADIRRIYRHTAVPQLTDG